MRICLILEGCYPYVHGGVSTWMHQYIKEMKEHEFVLWVIGAHAEDKGKFVYELPENVVEVKEVFLDDALHVKDTGKLLHIFTREEQDSLRELMDCGRPDWEVLFRLYHDKKINPMSFLKSEEFLEILEKSCLEKYPYTAFADAFHTMRSMLLPVLYLLGSEVPQADVYHAICTGYGMAACWHVLAAMFIRKKCFLQSMGFTQESVKKRLFGQNGSWLHTRSSGFHFSICCRTLYTAGHFRLRRCLRMPCGHRYRWAAMRRNAE